MNRHYGRIVVGVVLLIVAVLFALQALFPGTLFQRFVDFATMWWPAALIVIGVVGLLSGGSFGVNLVLGCVGLWFLAVNLGLKTEGLFLPFVLFVVAVLVLTSAFRARRPRGGAAAPASAPPTGDGAAPPAGSAPPPAGGDERIHVFSAFSGHESRNGSPAFREAEVVAIFGGASLDLRDAKLAPEGAHVELTALFGGAELVVPEGWVLAVSSMPIFGGVDNRTANPTKAEPGQPVLHVNATAIFGGAGVKNRPDRER